MADETSDNKPGGLPPKLDLRKSGILKSRPPQPESAGGSTPAGPVGSSGVSPKPAGSIPLPVPKPGGGQPAAGAGPKPTLPSSKPVGTTQPAGGPKITLNRPTMGVNPPKPAGARPVTPVVKPAGAAAPVRPVSPAATPAPASKKDTARIPLDAAKPRSETGKLAVPAADDQPAAPKAPSTVKITRPAEAKPTGAEASASAMADAEKRKTSRISLDAVLGDTPTAGEGGGPKTIRLKRPGEATGGPSAKTVKAVTPGEKGDEDAASAPTQRKTVVIKRSAEATGPRKLSIARAAPEADAAPAAAAGAAEPMFMVEKAPNPFFGVVAVITTLAACVLLWIFCAQAIGPNSSLTQYSYLTEGPDLAWPGKLSSR